MGAMRRKSIIGAAGIGVAILAALVLARPEAEPHAAVTTAIPPPAPAKQAAPLPPAADPGTFVVKRVLPIDGPFRHGDFVWDDAGVPAGPMVVTIDLAAQTLSVFRDGYEIGSAVILYGATDKPTPLGRFAISQKDADHVSSIYGSPMPYMLRLTNDGVSIHGSDVKWGRATHGCVGVPTEFAKKLFAAVKLGDLVIVTDGQMMELGRA